MKNKILLPLFLITLFGAVLLQSVTLREAKTEEEKIAEFLREMTDARIMDTEQGKLAMQRGTTKPIRDYAALMVKEQAMLMAKLKLLAAAKDVTLPTTLSEEKNEGLADLFSNQFFIRCKATYGCGVFPLMCEKYLPHHSLCKPLL